MNATVKLYSILVFLIFSGKNISAQVYNDCNTQGGIFTRTETEPKYRGQLQQYFQDAFKGSTPNYTGKVVSFFIIDKEGRCCCTDIQGCDSTALSAKIKDAIDRMKDWKPAIQNGHLVRFYARLKFTFNGSDCRVMAMQ